MRRILSAAAVAALVGAAAAQPPADPPAPADAPEVAQPEPPARPVAADPVFDKQVAMEFLADAVQNADHRLLADIALQLAAAEKTFGRPHRSGVSADRLLSRAAEMAGQNRDKETVDRLVNLTERDYPAAAARVKAARDKYAAARGPDALLKAIDGQSKAVRDRAGELVAGVNTAALLRDPAGLDRADADLAAEKDLPAPVADAVRQHAADARKKLGKPQGATDDLLLKLGGASRAGTNYMLRAGSSYTAARVNAGRGEKFVAFIVQFEGAFNKTNATAAANYGLSYVTTNKVTLPTNLVPSGPVLRVTGQRHCVAGWKNLTDGHSYWVAATSAGNYPQLVRTGGFLNGSAHTEYRASNYFFRHSDATRQYTDNGWINSGLVRDSGSGYRMAVNIGTDTNADCFVTFSGPQ